MSANDLRVAPLRRRAAATALDILLLLPVIGVIVWAYATYVQPRHPETGRPRLDPSRRWQVLFSLLRAAAVVRGRNSRSPGFRILRLRRVDARTGGPVSLHSGLIRATFSLGLRTLISRVQPRVPDERRGGAASQACGRAVLVLAAVGAPALQPPLHQNLVDRLAGTVVVED